MRILLTVFVLGVCCAARAADVAVELVHDGAAVASVVIAKQATRAARLAACELQYHVEKITGATLPIVTDEKPVSGAWILVGPSEATRALGLSADDFQPQEYLIKFLPDVIVLIGRDKPDRGAFDYAKASTLPGQFDEQSTCYAVYDFLERCCGVRWYLPTELGLCCPSTRTLGVSGERVRRAPAMKHRDAYNFHYPMPSDLCGNVLIGSKPPENLDGREQRLFALRHRLGGTLAYVANHSLEGYYDRFWNQDDGKPRAVAPFESYHPEYFAQGYPGRPPQLCYASAALVEQVVQDARDYFDGKGLKPGAKALGDYFSVVPMDNSNYCKCSRCAELLGKPHPATRGGEGAFSNDAVSDYFFGFVNAVAKELRKTHPDKYISTLAYASYSFPPSRVNLEPNIAVTLCLAMRNIHSPVLQQLNREIIDAWMAESADRPRSLWLYYCFPSIWSIMPKSMVEHNFRCFPGFFAHTVVDQMTMYHEKGFFGVFTEPSYIAHRQQSPMLDQLEFYVTWKLADDPTLDGDALIDEFFHRYYGAAAEPMRLFYEQVEQTYGNPDNYPVEFRTQQSHRHQTEEAAWKHLGTRSRMDQLGRLMAKAQAAAATELEKQRVALFDRAIWQHMQTGRLEYLEHAGMPTDGPETP